MTDLDSGFIGTDSLLCPACGGICLHHDKVEVYERIEGNEDGPSRCVTIAGSTVTPAYDVPGNPSCRRNGLRIHFYCELCPARPELAIVQHKGSTYAYWESDGVEPEKQEGD